MKTFTPLSIFASLLLALCLTSTTNAQNFNPNRLYQPDPVIDTLPYGTIIRLMEHSYEPNLINNKRMSSPLKPKIKAVAQAMAPKAKHQPAPSFKASQLIKSLNNQSSSFYTEKLDSIVNYNSQQVAQYDSTQTTTTHLTLDENDNITEGITQTLDIETQTWINDSKYVVYRDETTERLDSIMYYCWNDLESKWKINAIEKNTYNEQNYRTLHLHYSNWDTELNTWLNQHKYEYSYNTDGNISIFATMQFNVESQEWDYNYKLEYNYLKDGSIEETYYYN